MAITRQDIAAHLERGMRTGFLLGSKDYSPLRTGWVREVPSDGAFESYADMGPLPWPRQNAGKAGAGGTDGRTGAAVVNRMNEGGPITLVGGEEQSVIVYNLDWEMTLGITHNAIDDDRAGDIEGWARGAAIQFERHMDSICFDYLNQGESTTAYGGSYDKQPFFSATHADPGAEYQTAQDNQFTVALSFDNFKTVKVAGSKFLDGRGNPVGLNHRLLIVPPDLEYEAAQICTNSDVYGTGDRNKNPYAGSTRYIVAPGAWLDSTAWFLVDDSLPQKPVNLQIRKRPTLVIWDENTQGSGIRYYKWHARYAVFGGDWRLAVQGNT